MEGEVFNQPMHPETTTVPVLINTAASAEIWTSDLLNFFMCFSIIVFTHTHTRLMALFPGLPGWSGTRKVKPIQILLKQETVSGSGISWARCKSAPRSRQITMPAPHHSVFYRLDALPAAQPTASKHWRHKHSALSCLSHYFARCFL